MKYQGVISSWNDAKGYGFIEPNDGGPRAFVHIKSFMRTARRPVDGEFVVYSLAQDKDGRYKAVRVSFADMPQDNKGRKHNKRKIGTFITVGFCLFLFGAAALGKIPYQILMLYGVASLIAFVTYRVDKTAAKNNQWRTQESTLHFISLLGGWPGAFVAQNMLRHKSSKVEFKAVYWFTVLCNISILSYLLTDEGSQLIRSVFNAW